MNPVLRRWRRLVSVGANSRIEFFHMVSGLLDANINLRDALETVAASTEVRGDRGQASVLRIWKQSLADGVLAETMARWVPATEAMIFGAYGVGRVEPADLFRAAARVCELKTTMVSAVVGAVRMPTLLFFAVLSIIWTAGGHLFPELLKHSRADLWLPTTGVVVGVSIWFHDNALYVGAALALAIALLWLAVVYWTGPGRRFLDRFPPFSLYRTVSGASFLLVLVELLATRAELPVVLRRLEAGSSAYGSSRVAAIQEQMVAGLGFGEAMEEAGTGFPEPSLISVVQAIEQLDGWHDELGRFVHRWVGRAERTMLLRAGMLRLGMMIAVTAVMCAVILTMYDLAGNVRG